MQPIDMTRVQLLADQFLDWVPAATGISLVNDLGEALGDHAMFRVGRSYREAYIASRFALKRGAGAFRLLPETGAGTTPDFEIDVDGEILRYESTEADIPGRKRQDEYRQPRRAEPMVFTHFDTMVEEMRRRAAAKAAKVYDDCQGLVIWVNPPAFAFEPSLRWEGLVRGGEPAANAFREVWALRGEGSLLWLNGQPQCEAPGEEF